jgi:hypothetical protein
MAELPLNPADADALSGATDSQTDLVYPAIGQSTYYTTVYQLIHRLLAVAAAANAFRLYRDGTLTCGVRPGRCARGTTLYSFAGASGYALANDAVNYLWLQVDAGVLALHSNTTGMPNPATTPLLPLGTIATGTTSAAETTGQYAASDILDYRGQAIFSLIG